MLHQEGHGSQVGGDQPGRPGRGPDGLEGRCCCHVGAPPQAPAVPPAHSPPAPFLPPLPHPPPQCRRWLLASVWGGPCAGAARHGWAGLLHQAVRQNAILCSVLGCFRARRCLQIMSVMSSAQRCILLFTVDDFWLQGRGRQPLAHRWAAGIGEREGVVLLGAGSG